MKLFENEEIDLMWVDDQPDILNLSEMAISKHTDMINTETTTNPHEVIDSFRDGELDAIVSDYNMPQMTGIELYREIKEEDDDFPFILYTGEGTEDIAQESLNAGISAYFQKEAGLDHYGFIAQRIEDEVEAYRDEERSAISTKVVENMPNPVLVTDTDSEILYVNEALEEITGYDGEELIGKNPNILASGEHPDELFQEMYASLENEEVFEIEGMTNQKKNGEIYRHNQMVMPVLVHGEEPKYFVGASEVLEETVA